MKLHLIVQEREVEISSRAPCLYLVETAPSILRRMPGVVFREQVVSIQRLDVNDSKHSITSVHTKHTGAVKMSWGWGGMVFVYMVTH